MNTMLLPIRQFVRGCILSSVGVFSKPAPGIHILNAHRTKNDDEKPETFRKVLLHLSQYAELIRVEDAVQMIIDKKQVDKAYIAFTFDDGFMECYTHFAPVLEEFNINGLFFINPNYVEGDKPYIENFDEHVVMTPDKLPMRWEQIQELHERGHIIGAHTMDHFMINSDDVEKLKYQIVECKSVIEKHLHTSCDYFAFPYGKLSQANQKSIDIAVQNYKYVFSQSDYKNYFSYNGKVINRRHFEPFWPISHIDFFLSCHKKY